MYTKNIYKNKFIWIFLAIVLLMFSTSIFSDVIITTRHGINFWHALFEGEIFHFYKYNQNAIYLPKTNESWDAIYNIVVYIFFAIWDFPLWIVEHFCKIDVLNSTIGLLYGKAIVIPFLIGIIKRMYDLLLIFVNDKEAKDAVCMFLSSGYVLFTVITMGQYDVILLYFILGGIYGYCKNDKKMFYLNFVLAIPLKMFALFIFVPLVLLSEKNVIRIIGNLLGGCSLFIGTTLVSYLLDGNVIKESANYTMDLIRKMFVNNLTFSFMECSIFVMIMILICLGAYFWKKEVEIDKIWIIYLTCFIYASFCVCCPASPQWHIIMAPFMAILIVAQKSNRMILIFLETIATGSIILAQGMFLNHIISANMVDLLWLPNIFGSINNWSEYNSIWLLLSKEIGADVVVAFFLRTLVPIYVVSSVLFLVFTFPENFKWKKYLLDSNEYKYILPVRLMLNMLLSFIPIFSYLLAIATNN